MIRALSILSLLALAVSCGGSPNAKAPCPAGQDCDILGSGSKPDFVYTQGTAPSGGYQSNCKDCILATDFQVASDATQSGTLQTLYCGECWFTPPLPAGATNNAQPTFMLSVTDAPEINFCQTSGEFGALVPCDCSDSACIAQNTAVPSSISADNAYLNSCGGCSIRTSPKDNLVLVCAACVRDDGVSLQVSSLILAASKPVDVVDNCDGVLVARKSSENCPANKQSNWLQYLEKVWDKVKSAFVAVYKYLAAHQPTSPDGAQDMYQAAADQSAEEGSDATDAAEDAIEGIAEGLAVLL